VAKLKKVLRKW